MSTEDTTQTTKASDNTTQTTKDGGSGLSDEPRGVGACTVQGCPCPRFVGNQSYCNRQGCSHAYSQHDNAL
uniref:Zinc-binding peptide 1 n=1 Tax=Russula pumila TaxID=593270 RepID=A0A482LYV5_9AGAM|nr:zinc-binding peptide 1 [Russula pumila]